MRSSLTCPLRSSRRFTRLQKLHEQGIKQYGAGALRFDVTVIAVSVGLILLAGAFPSEVLLRGVQGSVATVLQNTGAHTVCSAVMLRSGSHCCDLLRLCLQCVS